MADPISEAGLVRDLVEQGTAVAILASNQKQFHLIYDAFRAGDLAAYQAGLKELGLAGRCDLVCEWLRTKECVFLCLHLCGPARAVERAPDPRGLAEAVVRITADEKALHALVEAVERRDHDRFQALIKRFKLEPYCHLFCHWVCMVRYRLICRWLCGTDPRAPRPDLTQELRAAGHALHLLLTHRKSFEAAVAASNAGDAAKLGAVLRDPHLLQLCLYLCEWFCSWRCVLACVTLCRFPVPKVANEIDEAFEFAAVTHRLAHNPAMLERLSAAVGAGDAAAFGAVITELKLQRFCIQICHWVCGLRCRRFCMLVCPPVFYHPWFTHVGDFGIASDIDPVTGLTNKAQAGHGGPNYGFFGNLSLRGFCPKTDPAHAGAPMAYRFLYQPAGAAAATPITGGFVSEVLVGSRYTLWNGNPFTLQSVRIRGTGTTSPTPPTPGPGLTPPDHFIVPDAQGWVPVDANALDDAFSGWLMGFASAVGIPGGGPAPGVAAGTPVPGATQRMGTNAAIIFQATRVSTIASVNTGGVPDYTNQLDRIHINNWLEVSLLDLQELLPPGGTGCSPLNATLTILYTADHELMADWSITLESAALPSIVPAPVFPSGVGPRGAAGSDVHDLIGPPLWPTCSYLVKLTTRRSLTDGLNDDDATWTNSYRTFCIGARKPPGP